MDKQFKDVDWMETFSVYGHMYVKTGARTAVSTDDGQRVICDPENWVEVADDTN